jgi:hypothetical protein
MITGFIEHLQIENTSNYSAIANSHTQQFTTARTKSSQPAVSSPVVEVEVTSSNGGRSPSSGFPNCPRASATSF